MKRSAPTCLLLVEDDPVDIYVIQRIVADFRQDLHLRVIPDGMEALLFLRNPPPLAPAPRPALILLDLKLPQLDGALLLPQIRQLPAYQATPIIVFSSTPKEREGERCFRLGATAYVQKSTDFEGFCDKVKVLLQHWLP
jgi:CheY-like chemotaxis protein